MRIEIMRRAARAALLAAAFGASLAAQAAPSDAQARYREDVAACNSASATPRANCLREAGAALQAARQNGLTDPDAAARERNALARCQAFSRTGEADLAECRARVMGQDASRGHTEISGSVAGGGILRESITTVPAATQ
ncbi:hypothetical protein [Variovorax terrae]|uniref:Uncharacterized protein n=1 Tax=Variovorax terrae TaxID=2923278 RepID=A0A9X1VRK3_9BURK|nr:hypothetical protein [Variovorax terrae]MCJ0761640.1 hypothetical protein [Variovorax terrae]